MQKSKFVHNMSIKMFNQIYTLVLDACTSKNVIDFVVITIILFIANTDPIQLDENARLSRGISEIISFGTSSSEFLDVHSAAFRI